MKLYILIPIFLFAALVSGEDEINCHCALVINGDDKIFVRYKTSEMSHVHDCTDIEGCSRKCEDMMNGATNNGDLNATPPELNGYNVGDFGCKLLAMDVDKGVASVYAKVCDHDSVKTNFQFKSHFCCRDRKHKDNCAA